MTDPIRISMWSGPRNISTTIMRSFENRADTGVVDEPFYALYLEHSGADHPYREDVLNAQPHNRNAVIDWLNATPPPGTGIVFEKHIAYHYASEHDFEWLNGRRVFLLIRDPRAMVASYANKFKNVAPIVDSLRIEKEIYDYQQQRGVPCPVIDATDILKNPEGMLRALCLSLYIPFTDKMLNWPAGARDSDGVWGPHWYDAVMGSTGFHPYAEKIISLSPELATIAKACEAHYQALYSNRLKSAI